jgi:hypothetical protein
MTSGAGKEISHARDRDQFSFAPVRFPRGLNFWLSRLTGCGGMSQMGSTGNNNPDKPSATYIKVAVTPAASELRVGQNTICRGSDQTTLTPGWAQDVLAGVTFSSAPFDDCPAHV